MHQLIRRCAMKYKRSPDMQSITPETRPPIFRTAAAYIVCIALIPLYVSLFPIWKYLNSSFGDSLFVYVPATAAAILVTGMVAIALLKRRHRSQPLFIGAIAAGLLFCIAGLIIPDPAYPVKRIHVAEYLILALVARYAMAPFLTGLPLLFFSTGFAALLGMHDEFLQGIHPARTYGLADISVNTLAAFGGGLIAHGLALFNNPQPDVAAVPQNPKTGMVYCCWLLICVLMLVVPAVFFKGMSIEAWTVVPLIGSMVFFSQYHIHFHHGLRHGITALSWAAWSLACYPLVSGLDTVVFY